jgi:site-specific recombinase XerD
MTNTTPAGATPAGSSTRRGNARGGSRRTKRSRAAANRRRRTAAAIQHRAVAAAFVFDDVVAPPAPPERLFVRTDTLEPAEVQALLAACSPASRTGLRDRALIAAGYWAFVRPREVAHLALDDFDAEAGTLTVQSYHSGTRVLTLPPEAVEIIGAWAAKRRRLHKPRAHVGLFCVLKDGARPGPITQADVLDALTRVGRAAKITKPVSMDALRNARARELALAGVELEPLTELLDYLRLKTSGKGLRPDYERARRLITELAPHAPCVGFYNRPKSVMCQSGWMTGREPANKGKKYPAEVLTADELRAMLRQLPKSGQHRLRNRALIVTLWRCGLRIAEALALEIRDVDLKLGTLTVRHGKGNKRRVVGLDPRAGVEIEQWLEAREKLGLGRTGIVFCTLTLPYRGRPMSYTNARDMLQLLGQKAGIQKRVHPHGLRHTHAFELMQEGVPLTIIQKQLGHNDLATTAKYVDHLAPFQVIEAMQAREWAWKRG